ncbi:unnamed protein product [Protopolystoma xenopodis]|uniref:Uncharacterized protein n=1 Tax=Protopolystoma xenopodis TaxID=117903 RepID=A0A3S5C5X1_9PLAT|nr:unnamed protein product [Protopolystoma xenopodis]
MCQPSHLKSGHFLVVTATAEGIQVNLAKDICLSKRRVSRTETSRTTKKWMGRRIKTSLRQLGRSAVTGVNSRLTTVTVACGRAGRGRGQRCRKAQSIGTTITLLRMGRKGLISRPSALVARKPLRQQTDLTNFRLTRGERTKTSVECAVLVDAGQPGGARDSRDPEAPAPLMRNTFVLGQRNWSGRGRRYGQPRLQA